MDSMNACIINYVDRCRNNKASYVSFFGLFLRFIPFFFPYPTRGVRIISMDLGYFCQFVSHLKSQFMSLGFLPAA